MYIASAKRHISANMADVLFDTLQRLKKEIGREVYMSAILAKNTLVLPMTNGI